MTPDDDIASVAGGPAGSAPSPAPAATQHLEPGKPVRFEGEDAAALVGCRIENGSLAVEIAHCTGNGREIIAAVLNASFALAHREGLGQILWTVHAAACAIPNRALIDSLERRNFTRCGGTAMHPVYSRSARLLRAI